MPGEPNNMGSGEDCASLAFDCIYGFGGVGKHWTDSGCKPGMHHAITSLKCLHVVSPCITHGCISYQLEPSPVHRAGDFEYHPRQSVCKLPLAAPPPPPPQCDTSTKLSAAAACTQSEADPDWSGSSLDCSVLTNGEIGWSPRTARHVRPSSSVDLSWPEAKLVKKIVVYQKEDNGDVRIAGNPAYASRTRGGYTKVAGLEHAGAPVYKRCTGAATASGNCWSLYKRSNGKWYLDFNEVEDSWSGTVNYALTASDTPFTAKWNRDMEVTLAGPRTGFELQVKSLEGVWTTVLSQTSWSQTSPGLTQNGHVTTLVLPAPVPTRAVRFVGKRANDDFDFFRIEEIDVYGCTERASANDALEANCKAQCRHSSRR